MASGKDAAHAAAQAGFGNAPYTNLNANRDLVTIVAIGRSESGGNENARNINDNDTVDAGYWQINQIHWHGLQESAVKDLGVNARLAKEVYDKQGFQAWTDYKNNKYRNYLSFAEGAVRSLGTESVQTGLEDVAGAEIAGDAIGNIAGVLKATYETISDLAGWFGDPHNWVRILMTAGGIVLGVTAIAAVASETKTGEKLVSAGKTAATKGLA
jgi:hypothetical protein